MFSDEPRCIYDAPPLAEVICQLRFPGILSISSSAPAEFQEEMRNEYPVYSCRQESIPFPQGGKSRQLLNHQFASSDGGWRINLSENFLSLSTSHYLRWEVFAARLDRPLATFLRLYKPAYYERIGLRYLNFISPSAYGLEETAIRELIQPAWLGPLNEEDVSPGEVSRCSVDFDTAIRGGCRARVHAGPGLIQLPGKTIRENKFVLDFDLYMIGNIPIKLSAGALETLHLQSFPLFRGAITERLHNAMEPQKA